MVMKNHEALAQASGMQKCEVGLGLEVEEEHVFAGCRGLSSDRLNERGLC